MAAMYDRNIELAIIGIAIEYPSCVAPFCSIPDNAFTFPDTIALCRAIKRLQDKGDRVDFNMIVSEVAQDIQNAEPVVMAAISNGVSSAMFGSYEAQLMEYRKRRLLSDMAQDLLRDVSSPGVSVDSLVEMVVDRVKMSTTSSGTTNTSQAIEMLIDSITDAQTGRCYTGIPDLDRLTGGFRGGKLIILGARPGIGKSALSLCIAVHIARHTGPVLIVSLEMDEAEIMTRIVAHTCGVDAQKIESGVMTAEEYALVASTYGELSKLPLVFATHATTPSQVRRIASDMKNNGGLAMVLVDYIQLMKSDGRKGSRYDEVSEISRDLKILASDLSVPVLALTQFNRQSEAGVDGKTQRRMPTMAEAKDSGSIEQDANMFMILWAPPEPKDQGSTAWAAYHICEMQKYEYQALTVVKNRQGRTGSVDLAFDKPHMRFTCIDTRRDGS